MGSFPDKDLGAAGGLNDTAIELGGSLGIAILGSVLASAYKDGIAGFLAALPVPKLTGAQADLVAQGLQASGESVGGAAIVAEELAKNPFGAARHSRSWTPRRSRSPTRSPGRASSAASPSRSARWWSPRSCEPNRPGSGLSAQ